LIIERNIQSSIDKQDFEQLFKTFFPSLIFFARKYLPDLDTAKEIVHNVFLNLWEKRDSIDTGTSLKSYLFTSVHNRCLNYIRDQKKFSRDEYQFEKLEQEEQLASHNPLEEQELESRIMDALNNLPEKCREVFMLSRFEGKKYMEIAEKLGISVKTVETQMSKALRILREKLIDYLKLLVILLFNHIS